MTTTGLYAAVSATGNTVPPNNNTGLYNNNGNGIPISGNVTVDNLTATGNINADGYISSAGNITTGGFFLGDGGLLSNVAANYGNANVAAYLPTYTGNLTAGNILTNNYLYANGQPFQPGTNYSNANVEAYLPTYSGDLNPDYVNTNTLRVATDGEIFDLTIGNTLTGGTISTTGTITGSSLIGGVVSASGNIVSGNVVSSGLVQGATLSATGNVNGGNLNVTSQISAATVAATAINTSTLSAGGNIQGASLITLGNVIGGSITSTGNATLGNIATGAITATSLSASGNITGNYLFGNGSQLTGLPSTYGNANVANYLASGTDTQNIITTGTVQGSKLQTSGTGGNIVGADYISANYFVGDGSLLTNVATSYGNANVESFLGSGDFTGNIIASGNLVGDYILGNGSQLTGLPATYGNANVAAYLPTYTGNLTAGNISVSGNITGAYVIGNGSALSSITGSNVSGEVANAAYATTAGVAATVTGNAQANITSVGTLTSLSVSGNIVTGNISATGVITGNGSIPAGGAADTYLVKNSASDYDVSWTDRVNAKTISENVKNVSGGTLAKGTPVYQVGVVGNTITVDAARADDPAKLAVGVLNVSLADQAEGQMIVLGEIKGVNTASFASGDDVYLGATGGYTNIAPTAANVAIQFLGVVNRVDATNGSGYITGTLVPDSIKYASGYTQTWTGNAWVATTELSSDTTPALGGNLDTGAYNVSGTGNITAGYVIGDGSGLTSLTGSNVIGEVANAAYATTAGSATTANTVTDAAQGNITSVGTLTDLSVAGNITTGNLTVGNVTITPTDGTAGQVLTTYGNGQTYFSTAGGSPGGANTQIQYNDNGTFAGNSLVTFDNVSGNIGLGNIRIVSNNTNAAAVIRNVNAWDTTRPAPGRIVFGTGYDGDYGNTYDFNGFLNRSIVSVINKYNVTANTQPTINLASGFYIQNNTGANITQGNYQSASLATYMLGPGNFGSTTNQNPTVYRGLGCSINVGNTTIGNTTVTATTAFSAITNTNNGSKINDSVGMLAQFGVTSGGANAVIGNVYGVTFNANTGNTQITYGNVYLIHNQVNGSGTHNNSWGMATAARQATNYYFIRNDDALAQVKLGSLRSYNEYQYAATISTGSLTIDKNNAQVQYVDVTEDITNITLSNFVTAVNPGTGNRYQVDTVTVIFRQDSSGRTIDLPVGSAYKYAGGTSIMGATPNAVQMVVFSAVYNATTAATEYLITISPEFV